MRGFQAHPSNQQRRRQGAGLLGAISSLAHHHAPPAPGVAGRVFGTLPGSAAVDRCRGPRWRRRLPRGAVRGVVEGTQARQEAAGAGPASGGRTAPPALGSVACNRAAASKDSQCHPVRSCGTWHGGGTHALPCAPAGAAHGAAAGCGLARQGGLHCDEFVQTAAAKGGGTGRELIHLDPALAQGRPAAPAAPLTPLRERRLLGGITALAARRSGPRLGTPASRCAQQPGQGHRLRPPLWLRRCSSNVDRRRLAAGGPAAAPCRPPSPAAARLLPPPSRDAA